MSLVRMESTGRATTAPSSVLPHRRRHAAPGTGIVVALAVCLFIICPPAGASMPGDDTGRDFNVQSQPGQPAGNPGHGKPPGPPENPGHGKPPGPPGNSGHGKPPGPPGNPGHGKPPGPPDNPGHRRPSGNPGHGNPGLGDEREPAAPATEPEVTPPDSEVAAPGTTVPTDAPAPADTEPGTPAETSQAPEAAAATVTSAEPPTQVAVPHPLDDAQGVSEVAPAVTPGVPEHAVAVPRPFPGEAAPPEHRHLANGVQTLQFLAAGSPSRAPGTPSSGSSRPTAPQYPTEAPDEGSGWSPPAGSGGFAGGPLLGLVCGLLLVVLRRLFRMLLLLERWHSYEWLAVPERPG